MSATTEQKQINIRVETHLHRTLEAIARQERRSVPQTVRLLLEEGLRHRVADRELPDDLSGTEIAKLALAGGAFDWLEDEPNIYDNTCGEPL